MATRLEYSVTAKCKPEHVWQKFQKIDEWPWWNRVVGQAKWLSGSPWQKGSQFLMELVYPRKVSFKAQPDGTTLIKTWEDISGFVASLFGGGMKQSLMTMHKDWLESLKTEAEKIAREEVARS